MFKSSWHSTVQISWSIIKKPKHQNQWKIVFRTSLKASRLPDWFIIKVSLFFCLKQSCEPPMQHAEKVTVSLFTSEINAQKYKKSQSLCSTFLPAVNRDMVI